MSSQVRRTQGISAAYELFFLGSGVRRVLRCRHAVSNLIHANPGGVLGTLPPWAKYLAPQGEIQYYRGQDNPLGRPKT